MKGEKMESEYPLMLYKAGDEIIWDGVGTDTLTVADVDEHAAAEKDGWKVAADYLKAAKKPAAKG